MNFYYRSKFIIYILNRARVRSGRKKNERGERRRKGEIHRGHGIQIDWSFGSRNATMAELISIDNRQYHQNYSNYNHCNNILTTKI